MQFVHQCSARERVRARAPDPTDTNHRGFNRFHQTSSFFRFL